MLDRLQSPTPDPLTSSLETPRASGERRRWEALLSLRRRARSLENWLIPWKYAAYVLACALVGAVWVLCAHASLDEAYVSTVIGSHLPSGETAAATYWLRLYLSSLPAMLLLSIAALSYISGAVAAVVLGLRAVGDGAVISLLALMARGSVGAPDGLAVGMLLSGFAVRSVISLTVYVLAATCARRAAGAVASSRDNRDRQARIRLLFGYTAAVLFGCLMLASVDAVYTFLVFRYA